MKTLKFGRPAQLIGVAIISLLVLAPGAVSAFQMTLTFDDGDYDPTIVYPGGMAHGPYDWVENNGIRAAGFWALDVGTAGAVSIQGHTHIQPNFSGRPDGRPEAMHAWTSDLQGLFISLESGFSFDVLSIDYSIRERESTVADLQRANWVARGCPALAKHVLRSDCERSREPMDSVRDRRLRPSVHSVVHASDHGL